MGYSTQQLQYTQGTDPTIYLDSGFSSSKNIEGYLFGLGYKQIIQGGFFGFLEGNYYAYNKSTLSGYGVSSGYVIRFSSAPSANSYNFLIGVGYKF